MKQFLPPGLQVKESESFDGANNISGLDFEDGDLWENGDNSANRDEWDQKVNAQEDWTRGQRFQIVLQQMTKTGDNNSLKYKARSI